MKKPSREDIAKLDIGKTDISRLLSIVFSLLFIVMTGVYPAIQFCYEWQRLGIKSLSEFQPLSIISRLCKVFGKELVAEIKQYETALEENSALRALLLAPTQEYMVNFLDTGTEKIILGRDGWLFYTADFNYLANPGFLQPERLYKRSLSGVQPDPVKAILHFEQQLRQRGIKLIVLPVPVKPMLYPDKLSGTPAKVVHNRSFSEFKARLEKAGVTVYDCAPELMQLRLDGSEPTTVR